VVVFEAQDYIGGHTHTLDVNQDGKTYAVNTGFIVFNEATYPKFIKRMKRLGVALQPSKMSFSVNCEKTGLEFSPSTLNSVFIQRRNLLNPSFYRMLLDVLRFKRDSHALLQPKTTASPWTITSNPRGTPGRSSTTSSAKYDRICRKLELPPADHVLEIGTGWGGFALHAATHYGCRVTTTTISDRQHEMA
jgi:hypothetical protein